MCTRGDAKNREKFIVHFRGMILGRPVTAPRSRCGLGISRAPKRINAREERHRLIQREFSLVVISGTIEAIIVNVSPRDDIQRHTLDTFTSRSTSRVRRSRDFSGRRSQRDKIANVKCASKKKKKWKRTLSLCPYLILGAPVYSS